MVLRSTRRPPLLSSGRVSSLTPAGGLDVKKRFRDQQIIGFLKEAERGVPVKELCGKRGFSEARYYLWRRKYRGMNVSDAKRLKVLEAYATELSSPRTMS